MAHYRTIDEAGNRHDIEAEFLPRIGERVEAIFGIGNGPLQQHFYRVQDVSHHLDGDKAFIEVRIVEEPDAKDWPR